MLSNSSWSTMLPLCVVSAALAYSGESAKPTPADVLLADGFESGNDAPEGWERQNVPGVRLLWDANTGVEGKRSLALQKSEKRYFPIAAWHRSVPHDGRGSRLEVSVQVKAERATKAIVDVLFMSADGKPIKHEWVAYIGAQKPKDPPATHDWKAYRGAVDIPPGTKTVVLQLQMYGPGKVWFDDLTATYGAASDVAGKPADASTVSVTKSANGNESPDEAQSVVVRNAASGQYLLVGPQNEKVPPAEGFELLVVLAGGSGSAEFHPFVRGIAENALDENWLVAQPLARQWTPEQEIVWPTAHNKVPSMEFTTEEFVAKVIEDVGAKHKVHPGGVYLLAWSSSGMAAYATLTQKDTPVAGAFIAMSVFKPNLLPGLSHVRGRAFYLLHSPQDRLIPLTMPKSAKESLAKEGARVKFAEYAGGHGWHGDVFGEIRQGIDWLRSSANTGKAD